MTPGPARTPVAILQMRGSPRAKTRENELQAEPGKPAAPDWLTDAEREHFERTALRLFNLGILADTDGEILTAFVHGYAQWVAIERAMQDLTAGSDAYRAHQIQAGAAFAVWSKAASQLGLSAGARTSLRTAIQPATPSGKDRFGKLPRA